MSNLRKTVFKGFIWDFSGKIAQQGISFLFSVFLTRLLLPYDFGLIVTVTVIIAFSTVLTNLGLTDALIYKEKASEAHFSSAFFISVSIGFFLTAILFFSAPYLATFYHEPALMSIVRVSSINILILSFGNIPESRLIKTMQFSLRVKSSLFATFLSGATGVYLALYDFGAWALVFQILIFNLLNVVTLFYLSKWRPCWIFDRHALKELFHFSKNVFLTSLLNTFFFQVEILVIGRFFGLRNVGLFNRARSLNLFVTRYTAESIILILFPLLSSFQANPSKYKGIVKDALALISFTTFGTLGLFYIVAEPLIITLFSNKWAEAVPVFRLLVLSAYGYPIIATISPAIKAKGQSKLLLQAGIYTKIIYVTGIVTGVVYGFNIFLYALVVTTGINCFIYIVFCSKVIEAKVLQLLQNVLFYLMMTVVCVVVVTFSVSKLEFSNLIYLVLVTFLYGVLYLFLNYITESKGWTLARDNLKYNFKRND